jgi:hypothetical protein
MILLKISVRVKELLTYLITSRILILYLRFQQDCNKNILMFLKAIESNWSFTDNYLFREKQVIKKEKLGL